MRTLKEHSKSEAPQKTSVDEDIEEEQRNSLESNFFCDYKMFLFKLKSPGFLN